MKKQNTKKRVVLSYVLYGMVLTGLLLYLCFPADVFTDYLNNTINRYHSNIQGNVQDVRPALPYGIKLLNPVISLNQNPDKKLFKTAKLFIRPEVFPLLKLDSGYAFKCDAYNGSINGNIRFNGFSMEPPCSIFLKLNRLDLAAYDYPFKMSGKRPTGSLSGTIVFKGLTDGIGEANFKISKGAIGLTSPFMDQNEIEFDEVLAKLFLTGNKIECAHIKLSGPKIQGTLTGAIWLRNDFLQSRLDLKGTIEFLRGLFGNMEDIPEAQNFLKEPMKIPFSIQGTILAPKFNFS